MYERFVLKKERTVSLYRLRDAGKLLINDAACADVGVADFAVAHLAVRQTDVHAGEAPIFVIGFSENSLSRFGLLAAAIALPSRFSNSKPSRIMKYNRSFS